MKTRRATASRKRILDWSRSGISILTVMLLNATAEAQIATVPTRAMHGMVVAQERVAAEVGRDVLKEGGTAVDAAVATAFALAVTHPAAGNIGGGGFLLFQPASGEPVGFDFREMAPAASRPDMWLVDGEYDRVRHHNSHMAVGVPGTVAGLHLAWKAHGKIPWQRLLQPAIDLASNGVVVTDGLARSLTYQIPRFKKYAASLAKFTNDGNPLSAGELWKQPELAAALARIAEQGPAGFYEGKTADLIVADMEKSGGIITHADLKSYKPVIRKPIRGTYRGHEIIGMPPPSSGGIAVVETLNILEGFDLAKSGFGSAENLHRYCEAMRRAFCDRAHHIGDPKWNLDMPVKRLVSKQYANDLRQTISADRAGKSSPSSFEWPKESNETTHLSVVDNERNAVALTYTLEYSYGSAIVVPGGGFLLNNEMGDFNPIPGTTNEVGYIGTKPNLAAPGKRMLSSMSPTIVMKDNKPFIVTGSPGGRTIINTTWQTIVNVIDFEMNAQQAVDAFRVHHQWLPDRLMYETNGPSPDSLNILRGMGHALLANEVQGCAEVIVVRDDHLEGGFDHRRPDGKAVGY